MLIEKGGFVVTNNVVLPESRGPAPAEPPKSREPAAARISVRVEWPEHDSPFRSRDLLVDMLQRALMECIPRVYQELEARPTVKDDLNA